MKRLVFALLGGVTLVACAEPAAPPGSLLGSCAARVEDSLSVLFSVNNAGQEPSTAQLARYGEIARSQCGCAERTLSAEEYRSLQPEVTTSYADGGGAVVTVRQSSTAPPVQRDSINAQLDASCPGEPE